MPHVVLVNGLPGSGKTTLAPELAARLRVPVFAKDVIKETLFDWIGVGDRDWSARLGAASMEVIWSLLGACPVDAVVESWFSPASRELVRAGLKRAGAGDVLEIWCDVPFDTAFSRFAERAPRRHPGHVEHEVVATYRARLSDAAHPLNLGPVLRVATDAPVDLPAVIAWIESRWQRSPVEDGLTAPDGWEQESGPLTERKAAQVVFAAADTATGPPPTGGQDGADGGHRPRR